MRTTHAPTLSENVSRLITWGRIVFVVISGALIFGSFVAGEINGARTLEPRVEELELGQKTLEATVVTRGALVDARFLDSDKRFEGQTQTLYEIKGYVKAIATQMGVVPLRSPGEAP